MKHIIISLSLVFLFACSEDTVAPNGTPAKDSLAVVNPPNWSNGKLDGQWKMSNQELPGFIDILCLKDGYHGIMDGTAPKWKGITIKRDGSEIWYEVGDPWFQGYNDDMLRVRLTVYSDKLEGYASYNPGYGYGNLIHVVMNRF